MSEIVENEATARRGQRVDQRPDERQSLAAEYRQPSWWR
jgi:hypothetical protein